MDVFALRNRLVDEYAGFTRSFLEIHDPAIRGYVDERLDEGLLWPDPLVQLNPAFEPGGYIDDLVTEGLLHDACRRIFRRKSVDPATGDVDFDHGAGLPGKSLRLHRHQVDAIRAAKTKKPYVLTTGTGSGKSLAYIVPIVDHVLRAGPGLGIQAIVVYPMNALANSQGNELEKFLNLGYPDKKGPVSFRRYTGQESDEEKRDIIATPPDILLTNYVMLELILTRPRDRQLIEASKNLKFLVLDELHTYRGRQGSDVALLMRRVRDAVGVTDLQYVGTSATLASGGTLDVQRKEIARVASVLFGSTVQPDNVIGETLRRATPGPRREDAAWIAALRDDVDRATNEHRPWKPDAATFVGSPLAAWTEDTLGIKEDDESGRLVRAIPQTLVGAATDLATLTSSDAETCVRAIRATLDLGRDITVPGDAYPVFPFRLHQFFGRGDAVYASLDGTPRHVTIQGQRFVPGSRDRVLLPLVFCRECGQDYYVVTGRGAKGNRVFEPRDVGDRATEDDADRGYLCIEPDPRWRDVDEAIREGLVPEAWLEEGPGGITRVRSSDRPNMPSQVFLNPDGTEVSGGGVAALFTAGSFKLCLRCGVYYAGRQSDAGKVTTLGSGGRSSATSLLSLTTIRALRDLPATDIDQSARKLLSFTDNRQDASLQAGHFNDFVEVGLLRAALSAAVKNAGPSGIRSDQLPDRVFEELALPRSLYLANPDVKRRDAIEDQEQAFKGVIGYRLYVDLRRGWRVTAPNLEQCGLLRMEYRGLREAAADESAWRGAHETLTASSPKQREELSRTLLDFLRRELAIQVDYLRDSWQRPMVARSNQNLVPPWAIDEKERLTRAYVALPRSSSKGDDFGGLAVYVSGRGGFGRHLRRPGTMELNGKKLTAEATGAVILDLFKVLEHELILETVVPAEKPGEVAAYQLKADAMRWIAGDGTKAFHDPIRVPQAPADGLKANKYFQAFYASEARKSAGIVAREHTAQVPGEERERREKAFREGTLQILYCSPTMELGVDIADLNVVNMRNVPPTPANYAQRSGRAGRSGSPALVFNYCTSGSPHDQYYFRRPERMVAGQVRPPRLELLNEDLLRAHVHAIWLAATGESLHSSLADILDLEDEANSFPLKPGVALALDTDIARKKAKKSAKAMLESVTGLEEADWYTPTWLDHVIDGAAGQLDRVCDRWREMYKAALETMDAQHAAARAPYATEVEKRRAQTIYEEASAQKSILAGGNRDRTDSDFNSYRYFASEGFLPGYSFPRLPVSAFIPGRMGAAKRNEYLSRPRFLAITEFGPGAIIYHEGSRYVINKVVMPAAARGDDRKLLTQTIKPCEQCGNVVELAAGEPGPDLCPRCTTPMTKKLERLFRLTNVGTRRRDRINSDEEERQRQGYEVRTGVDFNESAGARVRTASVEAADGTELLTLAYGGAATIWRINMGWRRRRDGAGDGFRIDVDTGVWERSQEDPDDGEDPMGKLTERVIPYVRDRRNALVLTPKPVLSPAEMASLGAALKRAIEIRYQLEDQEIAIEPLPDAKSRRTLLLFEAAEGGAGVLGRLVREPDQIPALAAAALELCHYDPVTLADQHRAERSNEDCEAACYDCLMSYGNQRDHSLLDRKLIAPLLAELAVATVEASPVYKLRDEHVKTLVRAADSTLEESWISEVDRRGFNPPDDSQRLVEEAFARPDFIYRDYQVAVFIDGPVHDRADVAERDAAAQERLGAAGWYVVRFGADPASWNSVFAANPAIFGKGRP